MVNANRYQIRITVVRISFLLLCFLALITTSVLRTEADTDTQAYEQPYTSPEPRQQVRLVLQVNHLEAVEAALGETIGIEVIITNIGTAAATGVNLQLNGEQNFTPVHQTLGDLEPGESRNTLMTTQITGYSLGQAALYFTANAENINNPVQESAFLTFVAPEVKLNNRITSQDEAFVAQLPEQLQVISEQIINEAAQGGTLLRFRLTGDKNAAAPLHIILNDLLPAKEIISENLVFVYQTQEQEPQSVPFIYDPLESRLTFTPIGTGEYILQFRQTGFMESGAPDDPSSWQPTFNEPVISLFNGSASYNYPILIPPGPGGFQPSLGLAYNSAASNGGIDKIQSDWVGWGWNLTGEIEVSQAVTICEWNPGLVCPTNAYWGADNKAYAGTLEFSLSIGGTGYDLIHKDGEEENGYPGRYYVIGNASIFVEYCLDTATHDPSSACIAADNGDGNANGSADEQQTHGFWLIKTPDNITYRLGYRTHSEQELVGVEAGSEGRMEAWSNETPYARALRWRADKAWDRFDNAVEYIYAEYWPSEADPSWSNNRVHAPASYPAQIQYGYARIRFNDAYYNTGAGEYRFNTGTVYYYGAPPVGSDPSVVSWQTHQLNVVDVESQSYTNPNGAYNKVRSYSLDHLQQRHGTRWHETPQVNPDGANQTGWCANWTYDNLTGWKVSLLTAITEKDKNGNPVVTNIPNVEFEYEFRRTGTIDFGPGLLYKYCYPYLTNIYTLYGPDTAPTASIAYLPEDTVHFIPGEDRFANIVWERTLYSGWNNDAPVQQAQYYYPAGWDYDSDNENVFNGFNEAKQAFLNNGYYHHAQLTRFLTYDSDDTAAALNGRIDWQKTLDATEHVLVQQTNSWDPLDDFTPNDVIRQYVLTKNVSQDLTHSTATRIDYQYDGYGNQTEVREFGDDLVGATPLRTQETLHLYNTSAADNTGIVWLINLAWRATVWEGLPSANIIISRQRSRYDNATCATPNALPTQGLLKYTDTYAPGDGTGTCGNDWLTTSYIYGGSGGGAGLWWQLTRVVDPGGLWTNSNWLNHTLISSQQNAGGTTSYLFNDSNTPWLLTEKIAANGSRTHYTYDPFSRLTEIRTPNATNGSATVFSQQYIYHDSANPLYIDEIAAPGSANPVTTRTFMDALGRPLQQRVWGMHSDVAMVVTDTEYDGLGQATCQTVQLISAGQTFNSTLDCHVQERTSSIYNTLGSTVASTGPDGVTNYSLSMGYTSVTLNGNEQLGITTADELGRMIRREEFDVEYDAFENGPFDTSPSNWIMTDHAALDTVDGQPALRMWGGPGIWSHTPLRRQSNTISPGEGAFFRFRLADNNQAGAISLNTNGDFIAFRFWANKIDATYNIVPGCGGPCDIGVSPAIDQVPNAWYRAQLMIDDGGRAYWRLWREDAPGDLSQQISVVVSDSAVTNFLQGKTFRYHVMTGAFSGGTATMYLADYQEGPTYVARYEYDWQNNLTNVYDASSNLTNHLEYNLLGQKIRMDDLDMGTWYYDYDYSGNLIRQTDGKNQRLCLYYDNLNRLDSKYRNGNGTTNCPTSPTGTLLADYAYYSNGAGLGQLQSVTGTNNGVPFAESFTYDYRGRVTAHTRTIDNIPFTITYQSYDILDRPTAVILPNGEMVTTGYDGLYADTLQASGQTLVSNMIYNRFGQPTLINRPSPVADTTFNYYGASGNYRLSEIVSGNMLDLNYSYDRIGNITLIENTLSYDYQEFDYDSLNRLISAYGASPMGCTLACYSHNYTYDPIGNIDSWTIGGIATNYFYLTGDHPGGPHAVTELEENGNTVGTFEYDNNGNMTFRADDTGSYTQTFDNENHLITINETGIGSTQFAYDANSQRLKTVQPDGTAIYYPFSEYEVEMKPSGWQNMTISPASGPTTSDAPGWTLQSGDTPGWKFNTADAPGWYFETPPTITWAGTHVFTGTTTIVGSDYTDHTLGNLAAGYLEGSLVPVTPGSSYELKAWIKGEIANNVSSGQATIEVYFSNGSPIFSDIAGVVVWSANNLQEQNWQQVQGSFDVPANMTHILIRLRVNGVNGWIAFDDLTLADKEGNNVPINNPGFEQGAWSENPNAAYPATSLWRGNSGPASAHGGQYSYVLSNLGHMSLTSPFFAITPGTRTIQVWVNGLLDAGTSAGNTRLEASYYDNTGRLITQQTVWSTASLSAGWQQVGGTSIAPTGSTQMKLSLNNEFNNASIIFDDVTISSGSTNTIVPDGDFEAGNVWTKNYHPAFPASVIWHGPGGGGSLGDEAYTFANTAHGYLESMNIAAHPNQRYELSALVRGELNNAAANGTISLQVDSYSSLGTLLSTAQLWGAAAYNNNTPTRQSGIFTTPANTDYIRLRLVINQANGWVGFSDIALTSQSAVITSGPGQNYDLSAWVRGIMSTPHPIGGRVWVQFYNSSNNPVGTPYILWSATAYNQTSGSGQLQSGSFVTPAGTASFRVNLETHLEYGWLDIDDVTLTSWSANITSSGNQNYDLSALVSGNVMATTGQGGRIRVRYAPSNSEFVAWQNPTNYNSSGITQSSSFTTPANTTSFKVGYEVRLDNGWLDFDVIKLKGWSAPITNSSNGTYDLSALVSGNVVASAGQGGRMLVRYTPSGSEFVAWQNSGNYNSGGSTQSNSFTVPSGTTSFKVGYEIRLDNGWLGFDVVKLTGYSNNVTNSGEQTYQFSALVSGQVTAPALGDGGKIKVAFTPTGSGPVTLWNSPTSYNSPSGTTQAEQFTPPPGTTSFKFVYEIRLDTGWLGFNNVTLQKNLPEQTIYRSHYILDGRLIAQRLRQENSTTPQLIDTFEDGNANGWTAYDGTWNVVAVTGGYAYRQSGNNSATNSSYSLSQSAMSSYSWQMKFNSGSRIGGLYFFASDPANNNYHGNAYYVYQSSTHIYICETASTSMNCQSTALPAANGETHTYRVTYNPSTGRIDLWRNGIWALSRTDSTPLTSGNHIAFRTQTSNVEFDNVRITTYSNDLQYFFADHLGSANVLSNSSGTEVSGSRAYFLPFGDYRGTPPTAAATEIGFTGHHQNNDVGLIYMNARYYVPGIGRFASADTIVPDPMNPQSHNRYSYTINNPINFTDPTGHRECGASDDCSDPLPHTSGFQDALLKAWIYYEDHFSLPFEGSPTFQRGVSSNHDGVDWSGNFSVLAPASGRVTQAGPDAPAGMWRIAPILRDEDGNRIGTGEAREWSVFDTATELPLWESNRGEDGLLEPERLLATGDWEDLEPGWSHVQGSVIKIQHANNLETIYYHTNYSVATGMTVNQGEGLGVTANNGWSSGTHLHYTLRFHYNDRTVTLNPLSIPKAIQHLMP